MISSFLFPRHVVLAEKRKVRQITHTLWQVHGGTQRELSLPQHYFQIDSQGQIDLIPLVILKAKNTRRRRDENSLRLNEVWGTRRTALHPIVGLYCIYLVKYRDGKKKEGRKEGRESYSFCQSSFGKVSRQEKEGKKEERERELQCLSVFVQPIGRKLYSEGHGRRQTMIDAVSQWPHVICMESLHQTGQTCIEIFLSSYTLS